MTKFDLCKFNSKQTPLKILGDLIPITVEAATVEEGLTALSNLAALETDFSKVMILGEQISQATLKARLTIKEKLIKLIKSYTNFSSPKKIIEVLSDSIVSSGLEEYLYDSSTDSMTSVKDIVLNIFTASDTKSIIPELSTTDLLTGNSTKYLTLSEVNTAFLDYIYGLNISAKSHLLKKVTTDFRKVCIYDLNRAFSKIVSSNSDLNINIIRYLEDLVRNVVEYLLSLPSANSQSFLAILADNGIIESVENPTYTGALFKDGLYTGIIETIYRFVAKEFPGGSFPGIKLVFNTAYNGDEKDSTRVEKAKRKIEALESWTILTHFDSIMYLTYPKLILIQGFGDNNIANNNKNRYTFANKSAALKTTWRSSDEIQLSLEVSKLILNLVTTLPLLNLSLVEDGNTMSFSTFCSVICKIKQLVNLPLLKTSKSVNDPFKERILTKGDLKNCSFITREFAEGKSFKLLVALTRTLQSKAFSAIFEILSDDRLRNLVTKNYDILEKFKFNAMELRHIKSIHLYITGFNPELNTIANSALLENSDLYVAFTLVMDTIFKVDFSLYTVEEDGTLVMKHLADSEVLDEVNRIKYAILSSNSSKISGLFKSKIKQYKIAVGEENGEQYLYIYPFKSNNKNINYRLKYRLTGGIVIIQEESGDTYKDSQITFGGLYANNQTEFLHFLSNVIGIPINLEFIKAYPEELNAKTIKDLGEFAVRILHKAFIANSLKLGKYIYFPGVKAGKLNAEIVKKGYSIVLNGSSSTYPLLYNKLFREPEFTDKNDYTVLNNIALARRIINGTSESLMIKNSEGNTLSSLTLSRLLGGYLSQYEILGKSAKSAIHDALIMTPGLICGIYTSEGYKNGLTKDSKLLIKFNTDEFAHTMFLGDYIGGLIDRDMTSNASPIVGGNKVAFIASVNSDKNTVTKIVIDLNYSYKLPSGTIKKFAEMNADEVVLVLTLEFGKIYNRVKNNILEDFRKLGYIQQLQSGNFDLSNPGLHLKYTVESYRQWCDLVVYTLDIIGEKLRTEYNPNDVKRVAEAYKKNKNIVMDNKEDLDILETLKVWELQNKENSPTRKIRELIQAYNEDHRHDPISITDLLHFQVYKENVSYYDPIEGLFVTKEREFIEPNETLIFQLEKFETDLYDTLKIGVSPYLNMSLELIARLTPELKLEMIANFYSKVNGVASSLGIKEWNYTISDNILANGDNKVIEFKDVDKNKARLFSCLLSDLGYFKTTITAVLSDLTSADCIELRLPFVLLNVDTDLNKQLNPEESKNYTFNLIQLILKNYGITDYSINTKDNYISIYNYEKKSNSFNMNVLSDFVNVFMLLTVPTESGQKFLYDEQRGSEYICYESLRDEASDRLAIYENWLRTALNEGKHTSELFKAIKRQYNLLKERVSKSILELSKDYKSSSGKYIKLITSKEDLQDNDIFILRTHDLEEGLSVNDELEIEKLDDENRELLITVNKLKDRSSKAKFLRKEGIEVIPTESEKLLDAKIDEHIQYILLANETRILEILSKAFTHSYHNPFLVINVVNEIRSFDYRFVNVKDANTAITAYEAWLKGLNGIITLDGNLYLENDPNYNELKDSSSVVFLQNVDPNRRLWIINQIEGDNLTGKVLATTVDGTQPNHAKVLLDLITEHLEQKARFVTHRSYDTSSYTYTTLNHSYGNTFINLSNNIKSARLEGDDLAPELILEVKDFEIPLEIIFKNGEWNYYSNGVEILNPDILARAKELLPMNLRNLSLVYLLLFPILAASLEAVKQNKRLSEFDALFDKGYTPAFSDYIATKFHIYEHRVVDGKDYYRLIDKNIHLATKELILENAEQHPENIYIIDEVSSSKLQAYERNAYKIADKTTAYGVTIDSRLRSYTDQNTLTIAREWLRNNPNGIIAFRLSRNYATPEMARAGAIGNPFNWTDPKYKNNAVQLFYDWLLTGNNFGEPLATEEYRLAIILKLLSIDNPNILYYKELGYPSHATVLGYLINHKNLLGKNSQSSTQKTEEIKTEDSTLPTADTKINIYTGTNENADLSNFAERPFEINNTKFNSVEQAFQCYKMSHLKAILQRYNSIASKTAATKIEKIIDDIKEASTGKEAKKLGNTVISSRSADTQEIIDTFFAPPTRMSEMFGVPVWNAENTSRIMKALLKASFEQNPQALERLLSTGNATLTHTQAKEPWKTSFPELLMEVRAELAKENGVNLTNNQSTPKYYEGNITPDANTIFVFGSNPEGRHGAGAAKVAREQFGAIYGKGEGLQGNAYALPTKDLRLTKDTRELYKDKPYYMSLNGGKFKYGINPYTKKAEYGELYDFSGPNREGSSYGKHIVFIIKNGDYSDTYRLNNDVLEHEGHWTIDGGKEDNFKLVEDTSSEKMQNIIKILKNAITARDTNYSMSKEQIIESIKKLYDTARQNPTKQFKVAYRNTTEASLNGYTGLEMIQMFKDAGSIPSNIVFSKEWVDTGMFNNQLSNTSLENTILPENVLTIPIGEDSNFETFKTKVDLLFENLKKSNKAITISYGIGLLMKTTAPQCYNYLLLKIAQYVKPEAIKKDSVINTYMKEAYADTLGTLIRNDFRVYKNKDSSFAVNTLYKKATGWFTSSKNEKLILAKINIHGLTINISTRNDLELLTKLLKGEPTIFGFTLDKYELSVVDEYINKVSKVNKIPKDKVSLLYFPQILVRLEELGILKFMLHPELKKYIALDYLFTEDWRITTVGSEIAHDSKIKYGKRSNYTKKLMESFRYQGLHKRNVENTATMLEFALNTLTGVYEDYNVAIIDDIRDKLYSVNGETAGVKPYDGATFVNPFTVHLENNSLGSAKAGLTKKLFVHFYDPHTGNGGIIKTCGFALTNNEMRNSEVQLNMMRKMTSGTWFDSKGKYLTIDITKDFRGDDITFEKTIFKRDGKYYMLTGIESLGNNEYNIHGVQLNVELELNGNRESGLVIKGISSTEEETLLNDLFINPVDPKLKKDAASFKGLEGVKIDSNYKLWSIFGGMYSYNLLGTTIYPSDTSIHRVVDLMNKVGCDPTTNEAITNPNIAVVDLKDVWQPLKHSDIHYLATIGAVKLGAANINPASAYHDDSKLNYMKIKFLQAGILLDKEHHADNAELSLVTLVINACAHKGYSMDLAFEMFNALATLAKTGTKLLSDPLRKLFGLQKDTSIDPKILINAEKAVIEAVTEVIAKAMRKKTLTEGSLISAFCQTLFDKLKNGMKLLYDEDIFGKLPINDPAIYSLFMSLAAIFYINSGIKIKIDGILSVLTPSYNIFKTYRIYDKDGNYKSVKYSELENEGLTLYTISNGENTLSIFGDSEIPEGYEIIDLREAFTLEILDRSQESAPVVFDSSTGEFNRDNLLLSVSYNLTYIDENGKLITESKVCRLPRDRRLLIKDIQNEKYIKVLEDITKGRELKEYNVYFKGSEDGENYCLYDSDAVLALFDIENLDNNREIPEYTIGDKNYLDLPIKYDALDIDEYAIFEDGYIIVNTNKVQDDKSYYTGEILKTYLLAKNVVDSNSNIEEYVSDLIDGDSEIIADFINKVKPSLLGLVRRVTAVLSPNGLLYFTDTAIRINGELITPIKESLKTLAYGLVVPKVFKTFFGLNEHDLLSTIKNDPEFFTKRLLESYKNPCVLEESTFHYELRNIRGDNYYILDTRGHGMTAELKKHFVESDIKPIQIGDKLIRFDIEGNEVYEMSSINDKIYIDTNTGTELIVTDNPLFYLEKLLYINLRLSKAITDFDTSKDPKASLKIDYLAPVKNAAKNGKSECWKYLNYIFQDYSSTKDAGTARKDLLETIKRFWDNYNSREDVVEGDFTFKEIYDRELEIRKIKNKEALLILGRALWSMVGKLRKEEYKKIKNAFLKLIEDYKIQTQQLDDLRSENTSNLIVRNRALSDIDPEKAPEILDYLEYIGSEMHASFLKHLETVVSRTPSLSMQSFMPMEIEAFDDPDLNTAYVSTALIWLLGSDYDVDAASIVMYVIDKTGRIPVWSSYADISSLEAINTSMKFNFPTGVATGEITELYLGKPVNAEVLPYLEDTSKTHDESEKFKESAREFYLNLLSDYRDLFTIKSITKDDETINKLVLDKTSPDFLERLVQFINEYSGKRIYKLPIADILDIVQNTLAENITITDIAKDIATIINKHNLYIQKVSLTKVLEMATNFAVYNMYTIINDPLNLMQAMLSVDSTTGPLKDIGNKSVEGMVVQDRSAAGAFNKAESIGDNAIGKDGIGIVATGLKGFFGLTEGINLLLNDLDKLPEERRKAVLGNGKGVTVLGKTYYFLQNSLLKLDTIIEDIKIAKNDPKHEQFIKKRLYAMGFSLLETNEVISAVYAGLSNAKLILSNALKELEDAALIMSALLSLATDNAKELLLAKLNANKLTLGLYIYSIAIGMPFETVANLLTSEIGLVISRIARGNIITGKTERTRIDSIIKYLLVGPPINLHKEFINTDEGETFSEKGLLFDDLYLILKPYIPNRLLELPGKTPKSKKIKPFDNIKNCIMAVAWSFVLDFKEHLDAEYIDEEINKIISKINNLKNLDAELADEITDYLLAVGTIAKNFDEYEAIKVLNKGLGEFTAAALIFSLNQGIPTKPTETMGKVVDISSTIQNAITRFNDLLESDAYVNKLICATLLSDLKPNNIIPSYIDLYRFLTDEKYQATLIHEYDCVSDAINVLRAIVAVPHFKLYLLSLAEDHLENMITSAKYNFLYNSGLQYINELGITSKEDKEIVFKGLADYYDAQCRFGYLLQKAPLIRIPKDSKLITINTFTNLNTTNAANEVTTVPLTESMDILLGTMGGDATFKYFMENIVIPDLKKGILKHGGETSDISISSNLFIEGLIPQLLSRAVTHNPIVYYTLGINMMPKFDLELELFNTYKDAFNAIDKEYEVDGKKYSIKELFELYGLIAHYGKTGQLSLMPIFADDHEGATLKSFHEYVASNPEINTDPSLEEILPYIIKRVAVMNSKTEEFYESWKLPNYFYGKRSLTDETLILYRKLTLKEKDDMTVAIKKLGTYSAEALKLKRTKNLGYVPVTTAFTSTNNNIVAFKPMLLLSLSINGGTLDLMVSPTTSKRRYKVTYFKFTNVKVNELSDVDVIDAIKEHYPDVLNPDGSIDIQKAAILLEDKSITKVFDIIVSNNIDKNLVLLADGYIPLVKLLINKLTNQC